MYINQFLGSNVSGWQTISDFSYSIKVHAQSDKSYSGVIKNCEMWDVYALNHPLWKVVTIQYARRSKRKYLHYAGA